MVESKVNTAYKSHLATTRKLLKPKKDEAIRFIIRCCYGSIQYISELKAQIVMLKEKRLSKM